LLRSSDLPGELLRRAEIATFDSIASLLIQCSWSTLRMGEADSGADSEAEEVDQKRPSRELATASSQS
jgi:hypothetical protein